MKLEKSLSLAVAVGLLALPAVASAQASFLRADCNADGALNVGDPIYLLANLFSGGPAGVCSDACDGNDDGGQDIGDAVFILGHLFSGGPNPPAPFGVCGTDPTADGLPCASFPPCGPQPEVCDNLVDDDGDGAVDCDDTECALAPNCQPVPEDCDNLIDDDGDGAVDCNDSDCVAAPNCQPLSHATDIQPIWTTRCISCHSGAFAPVGLNLTSTMAYGMIVGVNSVECPPLDRIAPGLPQQSFLYRKILGTQAAADIIGLGCSVASVGAQMPFGPTCCLPQADRDLIEDWIATGANP